MHVLPGKFRLKKFSIPYFLIDHQLGEQRRRVVVVVFAVDKNHIVVVIVDAVARGRNDDVILQLEYFVELLWK